MPSPQPSRLAAATAPAPTHRDRGLVAIIAYKVTKGVLWLVFAAVIGVMMRFGLEDRVLWMAVHLKHPAGAWSVELGEVLVRAASRRGLWVITIALIADGIASLVEGWALVQGKWWGPWLVVGTTSSLLPFEVVALVRHAHVVRALVLVANAAMVWYLARQALRERHAPHPPAARPTSSL